MLVADGSVGSVAVSAVCCFRALRWALHSAQASASLAACLSAASFFHDGQVTRSDHRGGGCAGLGADMDAEAGGVLMVGLDDSVLTPSVQASSRLGVGLGTPLLGAVFGEGVGLSSLLLCIFS